MHVQESMSQVDIVFEITKLNKKTVHIVLFRKHSTAEEDLSYIV